MGGAEDTDKYFRGTGPSGDGVNHLEHELFIDGQWVEGKGERFTVRSPVDNRALGEIPIATADNVGAAIDAADSAREKWRLLIAAAEELRKISPGVEHGGVQACSTDPPVRREDRPVL